jgi:histidinol-phosphatase (PHP family)
VAASGVAVEVSTAGLRMPVREMYPDEGFLRLCREREIGVTLGSDAHRPDDVGRDFEQALALLRRVGYGEICVFSARRRTALRLPP